MRGIVVYYSLEGNTAYAAKKIADVLGLDLLELHPKKAFPTGKVRKFLWGGKSALMERAPALEPYAFDVSAYDLIVLGFPVWASNVTPPVRTFLKEQDLAGTRVAAFACQAGNGADKAFEKLSACLGEATLEQTLVLIDPKDRPSEDNERALEDFCGRLRCA